MPLQARFLRLIYSMISTIKNKKSGYSLVETIIYIALLCILISAIIWSTASIVKAYKKMRTIRDVENSAVAAMDRMEREIRDADSVNASQSTFGTSNGVLTLNGNTPTGTSETLKFYLTNGVLYVDQNGTQLGPLTLSDVTVSNLTFNYFSNSNSSGVQILMTLQTSGTPAKSFEDSAVLRGSY